MALPDKSWAYVRSHEDPQRTGKVVPDPTTADPSAVARFGVNSAWHPELKDLGFFDESVMSAEEAEPIAERVFQYTYFNGLCGYQIAEQTVADHGSDLAFNVGLKEASLLLQRAINTLRDPAFTLKVDGMVGAMTVAALNTYEPEQILPAIRSEAEAFHTEVAEENPELSADLKAWLARDSS